MYKIKLLLILFAVAGIAWIGSSQISSGKQQEKSKEFKKKWYSGKAEITSYTLHQGRYGQLREGEAVLIFVTEDMSPSKHVKVDDPSKHSGLEKVMKLNFTKNFNTGIYPYSMMVSAFTPVSGKKSLKLTASIQEWCGQVYSQLNLEEDKYNLVSFSYFESEGDKTTLVKPDYLEDELWNMIRLAPTKLPTGKHMLLPSIFYSRLKHKELKAYEAVLTLTKQKELSSYSIAYPELKRKLTINFTNAFPYTIENWEEEYTDGIGKEAQMLITKAERKKRIDLDYWNYNKKQDTAWRDSLNLSF